MTYALLVRGGSSEDIAKFDRALNRTVKEFYADRRLQLVKAGGEIG